MPAPYHSIFTDWMMANYSYPHALLSCALTGGDPVEFHFNHGRKKTDRLPPSMPALWRCRQKHISQDMPWQHISWYAYVENKTKWLNILIIRNGEQTDVEPEEIREALHYKMTDCLERRPSCIHPPHSEVSAPATYVNHLATRQQTLQVPQSVKEGNKL